MRERYDRKPGKAKLKKRMTANANPKPFNMSRQNVNVVSSVEQLYWVYQSVNQSIHPFTVKLAEQNSNQRL